MNGVVACVPGAGKELFLFQIVGGQTTGWRLAELPVVTLKAEQFSSTILAAIRLLNISTRPDIRLGSVRGQTILYHTIPYYTAINCTALYIPTFHCSLLH